MIVSLVVIGGSKVLSKSHDPTSLSAVHEIDASRWRSRPNPKVLRSCCLPINQLPSIMDRRTPYTLSVLAPSTNGADESRTTIQNRLRDFVLEFQLDNAFIYR